MSLATRCSACGTAFRVVEDQLEVSGGWVRCGRCSEVFNALEGLFEMTPETADAPPRPRPAAAAAAAETTDRPPASAPIDLGRDGDGESESSIEEAVPSAHDLETSLEEEIEAHLFRARRAAIRRPSPAHLRERDRPDFSDARFDSDLMGDDVFVDEPETPDEAVAAAEPAVEAPPAPEFLRRAERLAYWQQPKVHGAMILGAALLLATLALQAVHHFRDLAAAQWPELRPALAQWCEVAGCTLEAPRRIEDITVESTALTKVPGREAFRLAVTLHSRSSVAVALPAVELSLTDASGKLVARKALPAKLFQTVPAVLPPGGEAVLQTMLGTRDARVTGYTVEIFYP
ncbi:MAG: zinc-ribbon and DUF3426 domain-containing protein [Caldimonas sp.]